MIPPLTAIGKVVKTHGVDGEVSVSFDVENIDEMLDASKFLFIYDEGLAVPFYIGSVRPRGAGSRLIHFDDVDTQEAARRLAGKEVYVASSLVAELEGGDEDGFYAADLIGFTVLDDDSGAEIGIISDINDATENALFVVETKNGEELIPIADEFITDIDAEGKTITLSLPTGLLEAAND